MGIFPDPLLRIRDPNHLEQFDCFLHSTFSIHIPVNFQHLGKLVTYCKYRIKSAHGFLENHRYSVPSNLPEFVVTQIPQIPSLEKYLSRRNHPGRRYQAHDRQCRHALSATRLTNQAHDLAPVKGKGYMVHCCKVPFFCGKRCGQIFYFEKVAHGTPGFRYLGSRTEFPVSAPPCQGFPVLGALCIALSPSSVSKYRGNEVWR